MSLIAGQDRIGTRLFCNLSMSWASNRQRLFIGFLRHKGTEIIAGARPLARSGCLLVGVSGILQPCIVFQHGKNLGRHETGLGKVLGPFVFRDVTGFELDCPSKKASVKSAAPGPRFLGMKPSDQAIDTCGQFRSAAKHFQVSDGMCNACSIHMNAQNDLFALPDSQERKSPLACKDCQVQFACVSDRQVNVPCPVIRHPGENCLQYSPRPSMVACLRIRKAKNFSDGADGSGPLLFIDSLRERF